jgi:excisionase family DNA binding protein
MNFSPATGSPSHVSDPPKRHLLGSLPIVTDPLVPYAQAVQRYTGLSRSTAERMAARGDVNVVRIGRRVLVRESEIRRLVEGGS